MGLFDFWRNKPDPKEKKPQPKLIRKKSENVERLDQIQKEIHQVLKPLGFKKRGRTFNRQTEDGVWQVINFQSGHFPLGKDYVIPGLRENYYGKFTVNLGVCIKELFELEYNEKEKTFYQDHDCQIRTRLSYLIWQNDHWWNIKGDGGNQLDQIIKGLHDRGLPWLNLFETREKIITNWGSLKGFSNRARLDVALIVLQRNRLRGEELIQEYYDQIDSHQGHKEYVKDLAKKLGVELPNNNEKSRNANNG